MVITLIAGMAVACILTAIEGLIRPLEKWRGLAAIVLSVGFCINLDTKWSYLVVYSLASTFVGLTLSLLIEQLFMGSSVRSSRGLPNRVDRL